MLVPLNDVKSYLKIVDPVVAVVLEADAVGAAFNKTLTGDGIQTLAQLAGAGYTFTSGSTVILGYQKTVVIAGGNLTTEASFTGSVANATNDKFLLEQIEVISDAIEAYCRRKFLQATYVQTYYYDEIQDRPEVLTLFHFPVQSVTSVIYTSEAITLDPTDYRIRTNGTIKRLEEAWFAEGETIAVTYVAGDLTVPSPVRQVVYNLCEERYNKNKSGINLNFGNDVQRVSIAGTISVDFDYSLSNNDRKSSFGMILGSNLNILDHYRSERTIVGTVGEVYVS